MRPVFCKHTRVAAARRHNANQTSMAEAKRRQRDESEGMSSLLILLASSRSVCSLEKLVTSVKTQKLPRVNSGGGGRGAERTLAYNLKHSSSGSVRISRGLSYSRCMQP